MSSLSYILATLENTKWNMMPKTVEAIISIVNRETGDFKDAFHNVNAPDREAYIGNLGDKVEGTRSTYVNGNTGIIVVNGPMVPRAGMFQSMSSPEMTSYERISAEFQLLESLPAIKNILFVMDTPGGAVTGLSELTSLVSNSTKNTQTYIMGYSASAGYFLATGTKQIFSADSGEAGSIGTVMIYTSDREAQEKKGIKTYEVVSSVSPLKRLTPESDAGRTQYQKIVDDLGMMFAMQVATGRKVQLDTVLKNFGQGGMLLAKDALQVGMIDEIITLKELIARNNSTSFTAPQYTIPGANMAEQTPKLMTAEEFKLHNQEAYDSIYAAGLQAGSDAERMRIAELESIKHPEAQDLIAAAKLDPKQNKQTVSLAFAEMILSKPPVQTSDDKGAAHAAAAKASAEAGAKVSTASEKEKSTEQSIVAALVAGGSRK